VSADQARAYAFFLRHQGLVSFMQGDLGMPRFLLLFINGKEGGRRR